MPSGPTKLPAMWSLLKRSRRVINGLNGFKIRRKMKILGFMIKLQDGIWLIDDSGGRPWTDLEKGRQRWTKLQADDFCIEVHFNASNNMFSLVFSWIAGQKKVKPSISLKFWDLQACQTHHSKRLASSTFTILFYTVGRFAPVGFCRLLYCQISGPAGWNPFRWKCLDISRCHWPCKDGASRYCLCCAAPCGEFVWHGVGNGVGMMGLIMGGAHVSIHFKQKLRCVAKKRLLYSGTKHACVYQRQVSIQRFLSWVAGSACQDSQMHRFFGFSVYDLHSS